MAAPHNDSLKQKMLGWTPHNSQHSSTWLRCPLRLAWTVCARGAHAARDREIRRPDSRVDAELLPWRVGVPENVNQVHMKRSRTGVHGPGEELVHLHSTGGSMGIGSLEGRSTVL